MNELVAVLIDEITVIIEKNSAVLTAGDEVFIPAHALHSVINSNQVKTVWAFGYETKTGAKA